MTGVDSPGGRDKRFARITQCLYKNGMKPLILFVALVSLLSYPALAQNHGTGLGGPIPCKLKVDAQFSQWDDRTVDAAIRAIGALSPQMPHVNAGLVFPRSGSNIRWKITIQETAHQVTDKDGHAIWANVYINFGPQSNLVSYQAWANSHVSYEAAVATLLTQVIVPSAYEPKAVAADCPQAYEPAARNPSSVTKIRAMAANISSGKKQSYTDGEGIRIFQGLKPDVVMIQEFNYKSNSPADLLEMIETAFAKGFSFFRESESTDQIPNGIISRFPILSNGEWDDRNMPNRDFAWARMDIPGDRDLWAISVHLHSKDVVRRKKEATDLRDLIEQNIPAQDYVLLGGDFNISTREDITIKILNGRDEDNNEAVPLKNALSEKAAPVDSKGRTTTNRNHNKNYDWVLTDSDLAQYQVPTRLKTSEAEAEVELENVFPNGLVFDSRVFTRLDRVAPILATDSEADQMQHMAVIKDFEVPAPDAERKPQAVASKRSIQKSKKPLAKRRH